MIMLEDISRKTQDSQDVFEELKIFFLTIMTKVQYNLTRKGHHFNSIKTSLLYLLSEESSVDKK